MSGYRRAITWVLGVMLATSGSIAPLAVGAQEESSWWSENFEVHGFLTSKVYFRNPNFSERFQMSSWRSEINLEPSLRLYRSRELSVDVYGVFRGIYDSVYDLYPDIWGDRIRVGDLGSNTAGTRDSRSAKRGRSFPGHGGGVEGEFYNVNNDTETFFTGARSPVVVVDDTVFYGSVPAAVAPYSSIQAKVGGNSSGDNFALAALVSPALAGSLALSSRSNSVPLNFRSGAIGDRRSLKQAPVDFNLRESAMKTDCFDNAHPLCFVRELYIELEFGRTTVRAGKQQIVWGKTDAFRLQDIVNPIDISYHNVFPGLEERRIPTLSIDMIHSFGTVGPLLDFSLELVWVVDRFQPVQVGQCGEPYAFVGACEARADTAGHGLLNLSLAGVKERNWTLGNTEPGARIEFRIPDPSISFSFSAFWGFQDAPVAKSKNYYSTSNPNPAALLFVQGAITPLVPAVLPTSFDPYGTPAALAAGPGAELLGAWGAFFGPGGAICDAAVLGPRAHANCISGSGLQAIALPFVASEFELQYPRVLTLGASADYQLPGVDTVLRVEAAFDFDRKIQNTRELDQIDKSNVIMAAVGLDRSTFIPFLNKSRTAFLSAQTFVEHIIDYDGGDGTGMVPYEWQVISTAFAQNYWRNDSIVLTNFVAYDWSSKSWITGPSLQWVVNDRVSLEMGVNLLFGKNQKHNIRNICAGGGLGCLGDPTTWQAGNWQGINQNFRNVAESPFFQESFADLHNKKRDEIWFGATYQF